MVGSFDGCQGMVLAGSAAIRTLSAMTRVALRSLFSRKLRTALTALAIVLGVAMVSGTYVLTDSINKAFDSIFESVYVGTDATITGKAAFDLDQNQNTTAPPSFDESLLVRVRDLPDVKDAVGGVAGEAQLIGKDGKVITFGGAPNLGFSVDPSRPAFESLKLVDGRWPGFNEVVIDRSTASKKHFHVGDEIGVQAQGPQQRVRISGLVKFGSRDSTCQPPRSCSTSRASSTRSASRRRTACRLSG
jgi:putative ABC transport system permease protein